MTEQQKPQQQLPTFSEQLQNQEQLQNLLKETMKENKTLQNKNAKLESKYVELFKEHKLLKKDHTTFITFLAQYFSRNQNSEEPQPIFQEIAIGLYELAELQKLSDRKQSAYRQQIQSLQRSVQQHQIQKTTEVEHSLKKQKEDLVNFYEGKITELKDMNNKEINGYLKELQSLKKTNMIQADELSDLKVSLQAKNNQISKISKEKLKLQHQLNSIRKKEFSLEFNPDRHDSQIENEKLINERNQFLSLRQQVETLMIKRDQLKRETKEKDEIIAEEKRRNLILQDQIQRIKLFQTQLDEKYELVRECSVQELQNLILTHQSQPNQPNQINRQLVAQLPKPLDVTEDSEQIQKEYLKNILIRYIRAETTGAFDQALTLLQIIGNILKLDAQSSQALQHYKSKRRQWWFIKY